jgi:hypothetical protein
MQTSRREGMTLLDDSLLDLVRRGIVHLEEAQRFAASKLPAPAGAPTRAATEEPPTGAPQTASQAASRPAGALPRPSR